MEQLLRTYFTAAPLRMKGNEESTIRMECSRGINLKLRMTHSSLADSQTQPQTVGKRLQASHVSTLIILMIRQGTFFLNEQEKCVTPPPLCLLYEEES